MERRRGDSYLGREFSEPAGLPEDVHVKEKLECVDCHQTGPGGMGHLERRATCQDCHLEAEQAMAASVHAKVACEACHVKILGGYEMTSWGPGMISSKPNPFKSTHSITAPWNPHSDQRPKGHLDPHEDLAQQLSEYKESHRTQTRAHLPLARGRNAGCLCSTRDLQLPRRE